MTAPTMTAAPVATAAPAPARKIAHVEPLTLLPIDAVAILLACAPLVHQWAREQAGHLGCRFAFVPFDQWVNDLVRGRRGVVVEHASDVDDAMQDRAEG